MTTDELLTKLPSHIGRNKFHGFYISDTKRGADTGWLYLHNDGKDWCASYGREGNFVCLNPDAEKPPYNNAVAYGKTPNEALQGLYDWCVANGTSFMQGCLMFILNSYEKEMESRLLSI